MPPASAQRAVPPQLHQLGHGAVGRGVGGHESLVRLSLCLQRPHPRLARSAAEEEGTKFNCFTRTKVHSLTPEELQLYWYKSTHTDA